jgi:hypothetical protein
MDRKRKLPKGRRIVINVNLSPEVHEALAHICHGNRSAAIEVLVHQHLARMRLEQCAPTTEPIAATA